jgi:hypothetical protein
VLAPADRDRLRTQLLESAARDPRIICAAITGSGAEDGEDRWSDIDLAFGVANATEVSDALDNWTAQMYGQHGALHHYDVAFGAWVYRVFLLASTLQVDLAFVPAAEFRALGPAFRLVFGEAQDPRNTPSPRPNEIIGLAWLYALHARSCIARGRLWQAEYMISGMRDNALALSCIRHNLPAVQGRGMDLLPASVLACLRESLVRKLDIAELFRAFRSATKGLLTEIQFAIPELAERLRQALTELTSEPPLAADLPMESKYPQFDRSRLVVKPLAERVHDLHLGHWLELEETPLDYVNPQLDEVAARIVRARDRGSARILMMGAHVLRAGVNRQIIDLVERGAIDHIAVNGAVAIHDYELARIGATTESVARYIRTGEFGLWEETGELNDWIGEAERLKLGLGENVGRRIEASDYAHKDLSVLAAAWRCSVPVTVHAGVGYDILHEHPNCDGAALGAASYRDFLIFAATVERLEGGVMLSFGSAVMAPEVYLKALTMSRNVARQQGRTIRDFATAVFDLLPIQGDIHSELPKSDPGYYFRPYKTILVRTVADGGASFYFCGDHRATVPALRRAILERL